MRVLFALLVFLGATTVLARIWPHVRVRLPDDFQKLSAEERVAAARVNREAMLKEKFSKAGLTYPPREVFLRAFKREAVLELWAREDAGAFRLVAVYPVLAASGGPGPKRREGDRQVPEGFYEIERFNPMSRFHLSLGIDYPNAADRVLSDPARPGGEIFIHGKDVSIGCLAIGDESIEELFLVASEARQRGQRQISAHFFPARMRGSEWEAYAAAHPDLAGFWAQLQPGFDAFENTRQLPKITVGTNGAYVVQQP